MKNPNLAPIDGRTGNHTRSFVYARRAMFASVVALLTSLTPDQARGATGFDMSADAVQQRGEIHRQILEKNPALLIHRPR